MNNPKSEDMETTAKTVITVKTVINAPVEKVWACWTEPRHITKWCQASDDWHAPHAENDLRQGGKFSTTMAARDGSVSFDFNGVYTHVEQYKVIEYILEDERKVTIHFSGKEKETEVIESFEAEGTHSLEMQQAGWQSILNNFKKYTEANG
jgi:uncharacterized protein YndB with AHSA1/START domain